MSSVILCTIKSVVLTKLVETGRLEMHYCLYATMLSHSATPRTTLLKIKNKPLIDKHATPQWR